MPDNGAPDRCKVCGATGTMRKWYEGSLGVTHGFLEAQIDYATEQAARIPALKAEPAILDADHG